MRRIPVTLSEAERREVQSFRSKGRHLAREVTRAHIMAALDRGVSDAQIGAVLGVSRRAIWRTRSAYQEKGLGYALQDVGRPGAPPVYTKHEEAVVTALACRPAPGGRKCWTVRLLTEVARKHTPKLRRVSRETVRRWLRKTAGSRGQKPVGTAAAIM